MYDENVLFGVTLTRLQRYDTVEPDLTAMEALAFSSHKKTKMMAI